MDLGLLETDVGIQVGPRFSERSAVSAYKVY